MTLARKANVVVVPGQHGSPSVPVEVPVMGVPLNTPFAKGGEKVVATVAQ